MKYTVKKYLSKVASEQIIEVFYKIFFQISSKCHA